nr:MFS transporter [Candidatus Sigynarchaeum springense]
MKNKYQFTFIVLLLLSFFSFAHTSIMGPMVGKMRIALQLESEAQVGAVSALFLLIGSTSAPFWAILGDRYSRKLLLLAGMLECAIFSFLTAFVSDLTGLVTFQSLAAIGFGSFLPLSYSMATDLFPVERRGKAFGLLSAGFVIGVGMGMILSGLIFENLPWFWPFIVIAGSGFIYCVLLVLAKEPAIGGQELDAQGETVNYRIKIADLKLIWRTKPNITLLLFDFVMFVALGGTTYYFVAMLMADKQFASGIATIMLIIVYISQLFSGPIIGSLGDYLIQKKRDVNGRLKIISASLCIGSILYVLAYSFSFTFDQTGFVVLFIAILFAGAFCFLLFASRSFNALNWSSTPFWARYVLTMSTVLHLFWFVKMNDLPASFNASSRAASSIFHVSRRPELVSSITYGINAFNSFVVRISRSIFVATFPLSRHCGLLFSCFEENADSSL